MYINGLVVRTLLHMPVYILVVLTLLHAQASCKRALTYALLKTHTFEHANAFGYTHKTISVPHQSYSHLVRQYFTV